MIRASFAAFAALSLLTACGGAGMSSLAGGALPPADPPHAPAPIVTATPAPTSAPEAPSPSPSPTPAPITVPASISVGNTDPATATYTVSEPYFDGLFAESDTCAGIATITQSGSGNATITVTQSGAGTCTITIVGAPGQIGVTQITSTLSSVIIEARKP